MTENQQDLPLQFCQICQSTGFLVWKTCSTCRGMAVGYKNRGKWLFWNYPLERYRLALDKGRHIFNRVRLITILVISLNFFIWSVFFLYGKVKISSADLDIIILLAKLPVASKVLFWLGAGSFSYFCYRVIREKPDRGFVERYNYTSKLETSNSEVSGWPQAVRLARSKRIAINKSFTIEALQAVGKAYSLADQAGFNVVTPFHLFYALLSFNRINNIFIRLGIPADAIQRDLTPLLAAGNSTTGGTHTAPVVSKEVYQVLFSAYETAYSLHRSFVSVTEIFIAAIDQSKELQDILYNLEINKQKLLNVVEWARIRENLHRQYTDFRKAARHRSKHGMDRAMTAVATPFLNQFSEDVTMLAQLGYTSPCIAREKEIEEVFQVVEGGQENVLLVGDFGTGKRSIIEGIAEKMVTDDVPSRLKDKRLVRLSVSSLLAGATPSQAIERLMTIMYEVARARNIILCIHNIHELIGITGGAEGKSLDVASALAEQLSGGSFMTIATTSTEAYSQNIANSKLGTLFSKVDIREMDENQAIQVLESKVGSIEYKQNVFFAYDALEKAVAFSKRFIRDVTLPGSALEIISEAASLTRHKKGDNTLVSAEEVAMVIAEKTNIPVTSVTADESTKLLHLEDAMHKRVIGQDEAVGVVANALRRARAEIRSTTRPIANFLFLGPTGVGKTELAKTIADVYFGGEQRMIRLDMSEYQDRASIYRLIGQPGEKGSGVLTEAVKRNPFSLLLLDEIEKADKDILNLFLQVMDDGRLTDSTGRVVDFTNVILIATSNAGTQQVQESMRQGLTNEVIKDRLLHGDLKEYFRPEFLNRFDAIVLFKPLLKEDIKKIAGLLLQRVGKDLEARGIELIVEDPALDYFATIGFDPEFGARPLRRALQDRIENQLAEFILEKRIQRHSKVVVGDEGKIEVV